MEEDHTYNNNNHTTSENNNNNCIIITSATSSSTSKAEKTSNTNNNNNSSSSSSEPVRSRWTPKPEQILILESIFNSGMVNPPKEETVRIRKVLEKFGAVGDANVFYWFQNRRSRSRRRQRQLQASLAAATQPQPPQQPPHHHHHQAMVPPPPSLGGGGSSLYDFGHHQHHHHHHHQTSIIANNTCTSTELSSSGVTCFAPSSCSTATTATATANLGDCSGGVDDVFGTFSGQMGIIIPNQHHQMMDSHSHQSPSLEFQSGIITVFINGVATQIPDGPFDMKAMFGEELMLVHSSGVPVPFNDFGISFHSLQHGESYFLVPRLA